MQSARTITLLYIFLFKLVIFPPSDFAFSNKPYKMRFKSLGLLGTLLFCQNYCKTPKNLDTPNFSTSDCCSYPKLNMSTFLHPLLFWISNRPTSIEPRQANLCLRAFRHDKFQLRMPSHSEGLGIWLSVWRFLLTHCIGDKYQIRLTRSNWVSSQENQCLRGLRPGKTQTDLLSYRD